MKQITYIAALAMLMAASCQKNELPGDGANEDTGDYRELRAVMAEEPRTRVGFDGANAFYWHRGDRIGVLTSAGLKEMTLDDQYHRQPSGVFYGNFQEDFGNYVVYPYGGHVIEGGLLTFVLPSSYTYSAIKDDENSFNPPMAGTIDGEKATLRHLASFFRISVTNIPAGGDDMKFVLTADKRITGEFITDLTADTPVIDTDSGEGNTVTINFSNLEPGSTGVFYVPAPLGTYGSITAEVMDGDVQLASKTWTDQTVSRMTPKRSTVEIDYVASVDAMPFGSLQEAIDAAENETITLVTDVVLDGPLVVAQGKSVTIDLNGHVVSETATSASASYLMAVKSGGELTLRNGTLIFAATTPDTEWGGEGQPPYPGYANNAIRNEGTLTIENTTVENKTSKGGASYVIDNYAGANLTINEGTVLTQSGGDIAVRMFNGGSGAINVTINGGTITGYRAVWIQLASSNSAVAPVMNLTVTGGTLSSSEQTYNQAVYSYSYGNDMRNVLINVSGGTFNGDIALTGGSNKTNIETLNISGGQFNGQWGFYSYGADDKARDAITVTGGTFKSDPTDYLSTGYSASEANGVWTVMMAK